MTDSVVSFLLEKLDTVITAEYRLLGGVEGQLLFLRDEFEFIKTFLRDAEKKRRKSPLVEVWVAQIRDVAFDVEDVIDAHILYMEQQKAMNWAKKTFSSWKQAETLHIIAKKIEQINERVQKISNCRMKYDLDVEESTQDSDARDISYIRGKEIHEIDVVGFHKESTQIANWLKEEVHQIQVISIIGMGGLGKTTLARKVFKSHDVINLFDIRIWITISQEYQVREILLSALKQVSGYHVSEEENEQLRKKENEELKRDLQNQLMDKKYLVVIDDIWKVEAWGQISRFFPSNDGKAVKVILTTRNKEVALHVDLTMGNHIELSFLNEEESWELFCKKVFHQSAAACPSELVESGKEIVKKCGGLPLAILVIGGILKGKRTPDEWSKVAATVSWYLSQDLNQCRQILILSYSDLPSYIKSCFLYLSIFPEDTEIDARRVIRLWVAEGFVESRGQVSMEAVAEDYMEELAQRSLIQVTERLYHGGPIEYFRVHDLLRDLAITESKKERFIEIHNENNPSTSAARPRRLAIHSNSTEVEEFCTSMTPPNLRCLFVFGYRMPIFSHEIKMLRVLDVEGDGTWKDIGKQVGKLLLLQYLRIRDWHVRALPSCICNLIKLQTLDIWETSITVLPKSIWKLKNLRHLFLPKFGKVKGASVGRKDFGKDLLTLHASGSTWMNEKGTGLSKVLVNHGRLTELKLYWELAVNKDGMNLKNCFPSTLTHLTLNSTWIKEDPSDALGSLPILKLLKLQWKSYVGSKLVFSSGKFPQLQFLELNYLDNLCEWEVEDGSIPKLRHLRMAQLENLKKLPDALRNVTTLQRLEIRWISQLEEIIQENGQDWETIKHIPFISYESPRSSWILKKDNTGIFKKS